MRVPKVGPARFGRPAVRALIVAAVVTSLAAPALHPTAHAAEKVSAGAQQKVETGKSEKININTATAEQLESLPGVGPSLAQKILEYRKENGAFKHLEELMNVKGIGEKSFQKLKDRITIGG